MTWSVILPFMIGVLELLLLIVAALVGFGRLL